MIYSLSPREIPWAQPSGFPSCSGYISPYIPPLVIIQIQYKGSYIKWAHNKLFKTLSYTNQLTSLNFKFIICFVHLVRLNWLKMFNLSRVSKKATVYLEDLTIKPRPRRVSDSSNSAETDYL